MRPGPGGWAPPGGAMIPLPGWRPANSGGGFLRAVLATILVVVLLDLVAMHLLIFGAIAASNTITPPRQVTVVEGSSADTIAAVPVEGLITDATAKQFDRFLTAAEKDKSVKAVVLEIDTPGGSATASDEMYHRLMKFKSDTNDAGRNVKVTVAMGGMATSGGYYVACGGDYIFAQPATLTANIGVIMPRFNVNELLKKYGVEETTIVASGCTFKNAGSMFSPERPGDRAYLQGLIDTTFLQFKKVVGDGRRGKLPADTSGIFNGRVYMADDALKLGLIDKIGYRDDAYAYAKSAAGVGGAKVVRYLETFTLSKLLSAEDSLSNLAGGQASAGNSIAVNGVNIDVRDLAGLLAPRPLYLWSGN